VEKPRRLADDEPCRSPGCDPGLALTAVSQTGETAPDENVLTGRAVDPDLRIRTPADWPDVWYGTTDQKVGGSNPSERARVRRHIEVVPESLERRAGHLVGQRRYKSPSR
jgi:hypothetical protein